MISILRRLRKSLVDSGSVRKYLLYAIGEILLVMIGILLALQVNNWNNKRLNKKSERKALFQLKEEFDSNNKQFDRIQKIHGNFFKAVDIVLNQMEDANIVHDDPEVLSHAVGFLSGAKTATYNPSEGIINSLINSGNIDIIHNDSLKTLLIQWKDLVADYQEEETTLDAFKSSHLVPLLAKYVEINYRGDGNLYGNAKNSMWNSSEIKSLINVVSYYRFFILLDQGSTANEANILRGNLAVIKRLVDQELERK